MNEAGVRSASRLNAGPGRRVDALQERFEAASRSPWTMMTSPSTTHRSGRFAFTASTTSGKYRVIGRSLRLPSSTSSPSRNTIVRNPSHLAS